VILFRSPEVALFSKGLTPVFENNCFVDRLVRLETDSFGVILDRAIEITFAKAGLASVVEKQGFGLYADSLVAILYRTVQIASFASNRAPPDESNGIVRLEADSFGEILRRTVQITFITARGSSVVE
jgi:hypothetical protein